MEKKILLPLDIHSTGKEMLIKHGYSIKIGKGNTEKDICEDVGGCVGIIARTGQFSEKVITSEPNLKVIARHGVGLDNIDLKAAKKAGVTVTNDPISNINAVAEHILALIISCSKRIVLLDSIMRKGEFKNNANLYELSGKKLGIIGFGKIGKLVAKKAALGFDMVVTVYDPFIKEHNVPSHVTLSNSWEKTFENSDFISVNIPLTEETKNSIGEKEFSLMKSNACFINCARGEIVDEEALINALETKKILMAGLDVFKNEPLPKKHPFYKMEQVIITPHSAALTVESMEKMSIVAAQSIIEVLENKEITYPVVLSN